MWQGGSIDIIDFQINCIWPVTCSLRCFDGIKGLRDNCDLPLWEESCSSYVCLSHCKSRAHWGSGPHSKVCQKSKNRNKNRKLGHADISLPV